jgi:hypothetical protein
VNKEYDNEEASRINRRVATLEEWGESVGHILLLACIVGAILLGVVGNYVRSNRAEISNLIRDRDNLKAGLSQANRDIYNLELVADRYKHQVSQEKQRERARSDFEERRAEVRLALAAVDDPEGAKTLSEVLLHLSKKHTDEGTNTKEARRDYNTAYEVTVLGRSDRWRQYFRPHLIEAIGTDADNWATSLSFRTIHIRAGLSRYLEEQKPQIDLSPVNDELER